MAQSSAPAPIGRPFERAGLSLTPLTLAADLGGTWMRAALVGPAGLAAPALRTPTADARPADFIALLSGLIGGAPLERAVVGLPGRIDHTAGRLDYAPNLPHGWVDALSEDALAAALGLPVQLANDADLACVGECAYGAGRGAEDVMFVTLSTGVGGGVVAGGRLLHGRRSLAEIGHMVLDLTAFRRGEPSTFEELASGTALVRAARARGLTDSGPRIVERALAGEPAARAAWEGVVEAACVGFRNLAYLYSPARIVVGGGLGSVGEPLLAPIRAALAAHGPRGLVIDVVAAGLGDEAGLYGAGAWHRFAAAHAPSSEPAGVSVGAGEAGTG